MRNAYLSVAVLAVVGAFVVGCASGGSMKDGKMMKDDKSMSMMTERAADKITVTTGRGTVTYGWDKKNSMPMALSGDATACASCNAAITGYYVHGKMPPATCPDCGAKIMVAKGS